MLKLMKYEFRKQVLSKMIILALVVLAELLFAYGMVFDNENIIGTSVSILVLIAVSSMLYISFEAIITYSNDLKTKCSYMLFLTPNTSFTILGAKLLSAGVQIIGLGLVFIAIAAGNIGLLVVKYEQIAQIKELITMFISEVFKLNITFNQGFLVCLNALLGWISMITLAFLSITLSTTILANNKFKGIVSFIIFIVLNWLFTFIIHYTIGINLDNFSDIYILLQALYYMSFIIITYFGTAFVLEKKLSV